MPICAAAALDVTPDIFGVCGDDNALADDGVAGNKRLILACGDGDASLVDAIAVDDDGITGTGRACFSLFDQLTVRKYKNTGPQYERHTRWCQSHPSRLRRWCLLSCPPLRRQVTDQLMGIVLCRDTIYAVDAADRTVARYHVCHSTPMKHHHHHVRYRKKKNRSMDMGCHLA